MHLTNPRRNIYMPMTERSEMKHLDKPVLFDKSRLDVIIEEELGK